MLPPASPPTLTTTPLLPDTPPLHREATDVSDTHTVIPLADPPPRTPALCPARMLPPPPAIVIIPPPLLAPFPLMLSISNPATSYDTAMLPLPTCDPTVTAPIPLPPAPADRTHATPVSDTHRLPSHVEPPARTAPLPAPIAPAHSTPTPIPPRPLPPPPLTPPHTPSPMSADTAVVRVPALDPIVTTPDTLPPILVTARHCTPVHDAHPLLSQPLAPTRPPPLHPPPPTTASQRPPAPAPLLVDMLDPCHTSYDSPIDVDPT